MLCCSTLNRQQEGFGVVRSWLFVAVGMLPLISGKASAQQSAKPLASGPAAVAGINAGSIRQRAAKAAEFRALLADPDPTVRLLTIQDAIAGGDPAQRQMAIEAGLASNESSLLDAALRGVLADTTTVIIEYAGKDGQPSTGPVPSMRLVISKFDPVTGRFNGPGLCDGGEMSGQFQGTTFTFSSGGGTCRGSLVWSAENGEFRGRVSDGGGRADAAHNASWKPR